MSNNYIVMTASAKMPSSVMSRYGRVAVVEVEDPYVVPKMIGEHARNVRQVVQTWERRYWGTTDRCAFYRALAEANQLAARLNQEQA